MDISVDILIARASVSILQIVCRVAIEKHELRYPVGPLYTLAARLINNLFFIFILFCFSFCFFFYLFCIEHLQRSVRFDGSIPLSNNKLSKRIIIEVNNRCLIDRFPL